MCTTICFFLFRSFCWTCLLDASSNSQTDLFSDQIFSRIRTAQILIKLMLKQRYTSIDRYQNLDLAAPFIGLFASPLLFYGFCGCWSFEESENRHILRLTFFNWATVFRPFRHVHFQKDEWGGGRNQQTKIFKIVLLIWELKFYIKKPQKPHRFSDFGSQMHSNLIWSVVNWIPIRYIGIPKFPLFNGHLLLGDCLKSS